MENTSKQYSLSLAIILAINAIVGAGIFAMPINLFKQAGVASIFTIALSGICVLFIGLAFARISFLVPEEGSFYTYVQRWGGKFLATVSSFLYLAGLSVALGLLCKYVSSIIGIYMTGVENVYIGYCVIAGIFICTLFASSIGRFGQIVLLVLTILPLCVIGYLCYKTFTISNFKTIGDFNFQSIIQGVPSVLFSFLGFESIASMNRVVENPKKNVPLATILSILICVFIYICFVGVVIGGVDHQFLLSKENLSQALLYQFQNAQWIIHLINGAMIITILGTIYAISISLINLFISIIYTVSEKKITPSETFTLLGLSSIMVVAMKYSTDIGRMFDWVCLCVALSYGLVTVYLLKKYRNFFDIALGVAALSSVSVFIKVAISRLF